MTWIHTHTGQAVSLLEPDPATIHLADIAHALSHICRYTGHTGQFYCVAEHSVLVADQLFYLHGSVELAFAGLMHDAHEAYSGDVASPIKVCLGDVWRTFERRLEAAVAERFHLRSGLAEVKKADLRALVTEARQVLPWPPPADWNLPPAEPYRHTLHFWSPERARQEFLQAAIAYAPDGIGMQVAVEARNALG